MHLVRCRKRWTHRLAARRPQRSTCLPVNQREGRGSCKSKERRNIEPNRPEFDGFGRILMMPVCF